MKRARWRSVGSVLELGRDMLEKLVCPNCGIEEEAGVRFRRTRVRQPGDVSDVPGANGKEIRRQVVTFDRVRGDEPFLDRTAAAIGIPAFDIVTVRTRDRAIGLELSGDREAVLGPLCGESGLDFE